ncbi:MAG: TIR domain-containing protein [Planctomycetes bacterium]|nr:TIR domain-containing protein [Planctomycetota bacterium]
MLWQLRSFPVCTRHVFLSHCSEDRASLVMPLYDALLAQGILPWLDLHDYTYGPRSFEALRNGVLRSRHAVFLVTPALPAQSRGWSNVELAWAHLLQENLQEPGGELLYIALPLVFAEPRAELFIRSVWRVVCDRCPFYRPGDGDPVAWALRHIRRFVLDQQERAADIAKLLRQDPDLRKRVRERPGMVDRIRCKQPSAVPAT